MRIFKNPCHPQESVPSTCIPDFSPIAIKTSSFPSVETAPACISRNFSAKINHKFQCRALFRGRRAIKSVRTTIRPLANRDKPSDIPTRVPFDIDVERILGVEGATLMTVRDELHRIVDELPDAELFELRHIVDDLKSGMEAEESVGAESLTAIQEGLADLKAGRTVNWETVKHENGL